MSKLFNVCGITTVNNVDKVRWTDDMVRRVKFFEKMGATRCDLISLPREMDKLEALEYIKVLDQFASVNDQLLINEAILYRMKVKSQKNGTYVSKARGRPRKNMVIFKTRVTEHDILNAAGMNV